MSYPNGQYFDPTLSSLYQSYQTIRRLHPDKSMPKNQDLPLLSLYQVHAGAKPTDIPEGYYAALKPYPELDSGTGKYTQVYEVLPIPEPGPESPSD